MLTITHTSAEGTLIEGTARGDGSAEVLKAAGWRWFRYLGCWGVPHSRDRAPRLFAIEDVAEQLRAAGFAVAVDVDAAPRDQAVAEADRAERMEARADALAAKAERRGAESESRRAAAHRILDIIPLGQPILIGHHSERRHRRDLDRVDGHMRAAIEAGREAEGAAQRAETARQHMDRREHPVTVANRILKLEADERRILRDLAGRLAVTYPDKIEDAEGHVTSWGRPAGKLVKPTADYLAQLQADLAHARAHLQHWRAVRDEQLAEGHAPGWGPDTVKVGDVAYVWHAWREVRRVNPATVSVDSGYSWVDRIPYHKLTRIRRGDVEMTHPPAAAEPAPADVEPAADVADLVPEPAAVVGQMELWAM